MSRLQFKPMLEAMDERIVPDATPLAPMAATTAEAAPDPFEGPDPNRPHQGTSDQDIADRMAAIQLQLSLITLQTETLLVSRNTAQGRLNAALLAVAAATTPAEKLVAEGRVLEAQKAVDDLDKQIDDLLKEGEKLKAELDALRKEQTLRRYDRIPLVDEPIYT